MRRVDDTLIHSPGCPDASGHALLDGAGRVSLCTSEDRLYFIQHPGEFHEQMSMDVRNGDREHAKTLRLKMTHDLTSDDCAFAATNVDFAAAAIFVVLVQLPMFPCRRRMAVVTGGMDAMFSSAKASWVPMQPGAMRVDDDMMPEPRALGHDGMVGRGFRESKERRPGIRGGTSTFGPGVDKKLLLSDGQTLHNKMLSPRATG